MLTDATPAPLDRTELLIESATFGNVEPFGTLLEPGEDGTPFGNFDAKLELTKGVPRFYIMTLRARRLEVDRVTRHISVTQCLASMEGQDWIIVMAPPGEVPDTTQMRALRFNGKQALCMHVGTWHAGPLLTQPNCHFINLEFADTNIVDHHTVKLNRTYALTSSPGD